MIQFKKNQDYCNLNLMKKYLNYALHRRLSNLPDLDIYNGFPIVIDNNQLQNLEAMIQFLMFS